MDDSIGSISSTSISNGLSKVEIPVTDGDIDFVHNNVSVMTIDGDIKAEFGIKFIQS